jgi:hypothetical protein
LLAVVAIATPSVGQGQPAAADRGQASTAAPATAGPLEAVMQRVATTADGTYVVNGPVLEPAPESARIATLLQADVLKGPEGTTRVVVVVGASASQNVDVRLRVVTVGTAAVAPRIVADAAGSGTPGPVRLVREFNLAPGDYELEAVVGHPQSGGGLIAALAKSHLNVPDVRGRSLTVTPIVLGEAAQVVPRGSDQPFTFGPTALTPAVSARFSQDGAISLAFRVFNWARQAGQKPDLTVEYLFYEQGKKGLHFFNKVKPQQLSADTLGASFDPNAESVAAGMLIPLGSFTFGDFQLTVRVTDNRSKQTAERQFRFAVTP